MEQEVKQRKTGIILLVSAVVFAILIAGLLYWRNGKVYESTDNAQLDCSIIPIRSVVTAFINSVNFTDNAEVKKGQVLFVFDTIEIKAKIDEVKASLEIANAKLISAKIKTMSSNESANASDLTVESYEQSIISAKANLDKSQSNYDRTRALFQIKAATQEQYESAEKNLVVAKADYNKSVSIRKSSLSTTMSLKSLAKSDESQIKLAEAQVNQCKAELILALQQLTYAVVLAPCNGIVSKRNVEIGQYVSAGQSLCVIVDNENLWVTANLKETQLESIKPGQDVKIKVDAYPEIDLSGKIESFSGATGAKYSLLPPDNSTGNFIKITQRIPVKISINNLSIDKDRVLFPGMSVFVKIYTN
ncbi:MAG: HlyD family secretion protein [Ignavibacteria bacterium]|nr:HlyD family secretion protein [Ignavibacteria bacterium]